MYKLLLFIYILLCAANATAQTGISGTVLDSSKNNYVEGVRVVSTSGKLAFTDSLGHYNISTITGDSLFFVYNNKPTQKFPVSKIVNVNEFNIALPLAVRSKYSMLKEVVVFSKNFREDSIANRESYRNVFDYHKPRVETSITPGGGVGMDANELINMFRFKRNKRLKAFQQRLEANEQEKYVNYRFNKVFVRRITQLQGASLDSFMVWYRPSYDFTAESTEISFNSYVLNASYQFRRLSPPGEAKKETE